MTLSRFLRDYLYIPLGGNRCSASRQRFNVLCTMVLGGLWHGASWNFLLWGALHGVLLVAHQAWRTLAPFRIPTPLAVLATFLAVSLAWIPFRASDLPAALRMWDALWDPSGFAGWPAIAAYWFGVVERWSSLAGVVEALRAADFQGLTTLRAGAAAPLLLIGLFIVWALPNTVQMVGSQALRLPASERRLRWRPDLRWAIAIGTLLGVCLVDLDRYSPFLYFQF